jgi:hypothetical protein
METVKLQVKQSILHGSAIPVSSTLVFIEDFILNRWVAGTTFFSNINPILSLASC